MVFSLVGGHHSFLFLSYGWGISVVRIVRSCVLVFQGFQWFGKTETDEAPMMISLL